MWAIAEFLQLSYFHHSSSKLRCWNGSSVPTKIKFHDPLLLDWGYCYDLPQNLVFELRRRCINQNKAESVTLRYSLYIYLTNPHGLYVISSSVVLALSSLHYVMQVPLLRILRHINVIEKWTRYRYQVFGLDQIFWSARNRIELFCSMTQVARSFATVLQAVSQHHPDIQELKPNMRLLLVVIGTVMSSFLGNLIGHAYWKPSNSSVI